MALIAVNGGGDGGWAARAVGGTAGGPFVAGAAAAGMSALADIATQDPADSCPHCNEG